VRVALYSLEWLLLSRVYVCGRTKVLEQQAKQRPNNPYNNQNHLNFQFKNCVIKHLLVYVFVGRPRGTLNGLLGGRYTEALSHHLHRGEYLPYKFGT
jgi:hypothetical protein